MGFFWRYYVYVWVMSFFLHQVTLHIDREPSVTAFFLPFSSVSPNFMQRLSDDIRTFQFHFVCDNIKWLQSSNDVHAKLINGTSCGRIWRSRGTYIAKTGITLTPNIQHIKSHYKSIRNDLWLNYHHSVFIWLFILYLMVTRWPLLFHQNVIPPSHDTLITITSWPQIWQYWFEGRNICPRIC